MGRLKELARALGAAMPTVLVLIGAAAVAVGIGIIYLPAGVIVGGALTALAGIVLIRGGGDGT